MPPQQIGAALGFASGIHQKRMENGPLSLERERENQTPKIVVFKNPKEHPVAPVCRLAHEMPRRVASPQQVSSAKSRWFVELMQLREVGKLAAYLRKIQWLRRLGRQYVSRCAAQASPHKAQGAQVGDIHSGTFRRLSEYFRYLLFLLLCCLMVHFGALEGFVVHLFAMANPYWWHEAIFLELLLRGEIRLFN